MPNHLTYRDAIDHLIDVYSLDGKDVQEIARKLRRAVKECCNKLPTYHDWEFLQRTGMFTTTAPYTTGTIAYTKSTRTLTLTGGTWPSDAEFGSISIGNKKYEVQYRQNDTVLILDTIQSPADDVAASTAYRWVRTRYLLPYDVSDLIEVTDIQLGSRMSRIMSQDSFWSNEAWNIVGSPTAYSLIQSSNRPGRWEIWLSSTPVDVRQFRYFYTPRWAQTDVEETNSGTVSISGVTATFSGSVLTDNHVGAVLRVSSTAAIPTSEIGRYDQTAKPPAVIYNPAASEHIIVQKNSATEAIINVAPSSTVTTKGYTISSHIRVNTEGMLDFFHRLLEHQWNIISRADSKALSNTNAFMLESLRLAMAADARNIQSPRHRESYSRPIITES